MREKERLNGGAEALRQREERTQDKTACVDLVGWHVSLS